MSRIILTDTSKNGVKNAKTVKPQNTKKYRKLVKEANERIQNDKAEKYADLMKRQGF